MTGTLTTLREPRAPGELASTRRPRRWGRVGLGLLVPVLALALWEVGAMTGIVVSGNLIGRTQTATLYVHDGIESFRPEGAYAASLVLAALSFVLLVGMELVRKRLAAREEG